MNIIFLRRISICITLLFALPAHGEENPPTWPCDQIYTLKVPIATVWQGPSIDAMRDTWWEDSNVFQTVAELKSPALEEEGIQAIIASYAQTVPKSERKQKMTMLFAGIYQHTLDARRRQLAGILNFVNRQKKITDRISLTSKKLRELRKKDVPPEAPEYREVEAEMEWNARVFDERQRLTYYVCEQPILLVQRLGIAARTIESYLSE